MKRIEPLLQIFILALNPGFPHIFSFIFDYFQNLPVSSIFLLAPLAYLFAFFPLLPVINWIWLWPQIKTSRCVQSVFHSPWTVIALTTVEGSGALGGVKQFSTSIQCIMSREHTFVFVCVTE